MIRIRKIRKHLHESNIRNNRFKRVLRENKYNKRLIESDDDVTVPFQFSQQDLMNPDALDLKGIGKNLVGQEKGRRAEIAHQEKIAQLEQKYSYIFDIIKQNPNGSVAIEKLFNELVPSNGQAETVAGELVRAANKIGYRWNNDGDILCVGYGIDTCANAINYICSFIPSVEDDVFELADNLTGVEDSDDAEYESFLGTLYQTVTDWIADNPEQALQPATDMLSKQFKDDSWLIELEPKTEYEVSWDYNYELSNYIDEFEDIIDYSKDDLLTDFQDDYGLEDVFNRLRVVRTGGYRDVIFYDVPVSSLSEFEDEISSWFDYKYNELQDEFGTYDELSNPEDEVEDEVEDEN